MLEFGEGQNFTIEIPSLGASETIQFTTNYPWTASSSESWLSLSASEGNAGKNSLTVMASLNEDIAAREAEVTIESGNLSKKITVRQGGFQTYVVPVKEYEIGRNGGTLTIPVSANVDYTVKVAEECSSWLSIVKTKALTEYTIQVKVEKNETDESRTGKVMVEYESKSETITILQWCELAFDPEFLRVLKEKGYVPDVAEVSYMDVNSIDTLDVSGQNLTSLKGIEYFISLKKLYCYNNSLESLDVSKNTELEWLICYSNYLTSLDLSNNPNLKSLSCGGDGYRYDNEGNLIAFSSLDISNCISLENLNISNSLLTSLDLSNLPNLKYLYYSGLGKNAPGLEELDLSGCTSLESVVVNSCPLLTSLDLSNLTSLKQLRCGNNYQVDYSGNVFGLEELKIDNCTSLEYVSVGGCPLITSLDLSNLTSLKQLSCSSNFQMDYNSGNVFGLEELKIDNCTSLEYVSVGRCPLITSLDFSNLSSLKYLSCQYNRNEHNGDVFGLKDLKMDNCPALETLYCNGNLITVLDVTDMPVLKDLNFSNNPELTTFKIGNNAVLESLDCSGNPHLATMDFGNCTALKALSLNSNQLTSLNLRSTPKLETLSCSSNLLTSLDLSGVPGLKSLSCSGNPMPTLDLSSVPELEILSCGSEDLMSLDLSSISKLKELYCFDSQLTSLDLAVVPELKNLRCNNNRNLTSLDVSQNQNLEILTCFGNRLESMDISQNIKLYDFRCEGNKGLNGKFVVKAWFDNNNIPNGSVQNGDEYIYYSFTDRGWYYNTPDGSVNVEIEYVDVVNQES